MKDEIAKILAMVQEGKLEVEKASELIQLLKEKGGELTKSNNYLDKTLRIRVNSQSNDNVLVNLPIKLVKAVLKAGVGIAAGIPEANKYVKDIDVDLLLEAIENELVGPIVDVKSANGDTVAVFIE